MLHKKPRIDQPTNYDNPYLQSNDDRFELETTPKNNKGIYDKEEGLWFVPAKDKDQKRRVTGTGIKYAYIIFRHLDKPIPEGTVIFKKEKDLNSPSGRVYVYNTKDKLMLQIEKNYQRKYKIKRSSITTSAEEKKIEPSLARVFLTATNDNHQPIVYKKISYERIKKDDKPYTTKKEVNRRYGIQGQLQPLPEGILLLKKQNYTPHVRGTRLYIYDLANKEVLRIVPHRNTSELTPSKQSSPEQPLSAAPASPSLELKLVSTKKYLTVDDKEAKSLFVTRAPNNLPSIKHSSGFYFPATESNGEYLISNENEEYFLSPQRQIISLPNDVMFLKKFQGNPSEIFIYEKTEKEFIRIDRMLKLNPEEKLESHNKTSHSFLSSNSLFKKPVAENTHEDFAQILLSLNSLRHNR